MVYLLVKSKLAVKGFRAFALFVAIYAISTFIIVPGIAPIFGRVPLPIFGSLKPLNITTCILNRHYVAPALKLQMQDITQKMKTSFLGTKVNYLDASFPFFDGFPLLPHLSHDDGKKLDLAFYYLDKNTGEKTNNSPSHMGYGAFEAPRKGEVNYPERCRSDGFLMYNMLEVLRPLINDDQYSIDQERTTHFLQLLANDSRTSKLFIEPHLKVRWGLQGRAKIRFHGCQAVRHDDHIHMQIF